MISSHFLFYSGEMRFNCSKIVRSSLSRKTHSDYNSYILKSISRLCLIPRNRSCASSLKRLQSTQTIANLSKLKLDSPSMILSAFSQKIYERTSSSQRSVSICLLRIKNSSRLQTPFPSKSDAANAFITYVFARFTSYLYFSNILFKNTSKSIIPAECSPLGSVSFKDSIAFLNSLFSSNVIRVSANVP